MSVVSRIEVFTAQLPFRFSFGHALTSRRSSTNVYAKLTLDDGSVGYGEGVPREYVTGETVESALGAIIERHAPGIIGRSIDTVDDVPNLLSDVMRSTTSNGGIPGAAWCAIELAVLDAAGHRFNRSVQHWIGPPVTQTVKYDAILPFARPWQLVAVAGVIRALGFSQTKIKVGKSLDQDVKALRTLRTVLGTRMDIRVDANCAWTAEQALEAITSMRRYGITAVEQPVPAHDLEGLRLLTAATSELIIVDESLRSLEEAQNLIQQAACNAFNIRVSKCGGLLASREIARAGAKAGLKCIVGAQVGESGILSAAGRHLAVAIDPMYLEGSAGRLLLKEDVTVENVLPGWGGTARPFEGPGLGVHIKEDVLRAHGQVCRVFETSG